MLDGGIAAAAKHHSFLDAHCQLFFLYYFYLSLLNLRHEHALPHAYNGSISGQSSTLEHSSCERRRCMARSTTQEYQHNTVLSPKEKLLFQNYVNQCEREGRVWISTTQHVKRGSDSFTRTFQEPCNNTVNVEFLCHGSGGLWWRLWQSHSMLLKIGFIN